MAHHVYFGQQHGFPVLDDWDDILVNFVYGHMVLREHIPYDPCMVIINYIYPHLVDFYGIFTDIYPHLVDLYGRCR